MKKILVVDDDPDILNMLQMRLESEDFEVETAVDAADALDKISKQVPDLITLDILMPGVVGGEGGYGASLCETLKNDDAYGKIPIIMLSALDRNAKPEIEAMVELADAYIGKPFDSKDLIQKIRELLAG